jgi:hypothetical protein
MERSAIRERTLLQNPGFRCASSGLRFSVSIAATRNDRAESLYMTNVIVYLSTFYVNCHILG